MSAPWKLRLTLSPWLQYAYFLRFSLLFWLALPVLCALDYFTGLRSLTRGIMTLSSSWQAFHATFFVISLMMAVLVCLRNIVRNGRARFHSPRPSRLYHICTTCQPRTVWALLAVAQFPALITLIYVINTTLREGEFAAPHRWKLFAGTFAGIAAAAVFWYIISIFYLWTYPDDPTVEPSALIYPGNMPLFAYARTMPQPLISVWIEALGRRLLWFTYEGYAASQEGPLWELHSFTTVALGAILLLYLFLYPLIAPVVFSNGHGEMALAIIAVVVFAIGATSTRAARRSTIDPARRISVLGSAFLAVALIAAVFFFILLIYDNRTQGVLLETSFPVLASVVVIFIFFLWLLSGMSFLLDRYRVPVLTLSLLVVFLPKCLPFINQEHYFEAIDTTRVMAVDNPGEVLAHRMRNPADPYIIVTASGGGIRAAEWTAQVMARLEATFQNDATLRDRHYTFHDHVLLASGVSGGSVGLLPFLAEYTAVDAAPFPAAKLDLLSQRITRAPGCSSLEAVAWGLEYYDLQRLLLSVRLPWLQNTDTHGVAPDRTWALTRALQRNLNDKECGTDMLGSDAGLPRLWSGNQLTLSTTAGLLRRGAMPAFTFNTTAAETGGRFLLSNYVVNQPLIPPPSSPLQSNTDFLPSESFLQAYAQESRCEQGSLNSLCYADISLATAARLSATFPAVSSATRIPAKYSARASHFVDGGYFDNDGTASVTEFLYAAMSQRQPTDLPVKILLIEIRDGDDLNPARNADDYQHQNGLDLEKGSAPPSAWNTISQLQAPLLGMWNAGHVSVTRRNRRELCMLESTFARANQLEVHHVVLGITDEPEPGHPGKFKTSPLSWKLTPAQKKYIEDWASLPSSPTRPSMEEALRWVKDRLPGTATAAQAPTSQPPAAPASCQAIDQNYMRY